MMTKFIRPRCLGFTISLLSIAAPLTVSSSEVPILENCGLNCLLVALELKKVEPSEYSEMLPVSSKTRQQLLTNRAYSLRELGELLVSRGLSVVGLRDTTIEALAKSMNLESTAIIRLAYKYDVYHFIVLHKVEEDRIELYDYPNKKLILSIQELKNQFGSLFTGEGICISRESGVLDKGLLGKLESEAREKAVSAAEVADPSKEKKFVDEKGASKDFRRHVVDVRYREGDFSKLQGNFEISDIESANLKDVDLVTIKGSCSCFIGYEEKENGSISVEFNAYQFDYERGTDLAVVLRINNVEKIFPVAVMGTRDIEQQGLFCSPRRFLKESQDQSGSRTLKAYIPGAIVLDDFVERFEWSSSYDVDIKRMENFSLADKAFTVVELSLKSKVNNMDENPFWIELVGGSRLVIPFY